MNLSIVDDQTILSEGLKRILESYEDINVVSIGKNGKEAIEIVKNNKIDVLLMDIRMPDLNGVEAVKEIRKFNTSTKIIMLTTFDDEEYIINAMAYKADGYVFKDIEYDKLVSVIRDVFEGKYIIEPKVAQVLASNITLNNPQNKLDKYNLTDREKEITDMIQMGFNNKQIANALFLSEGTVKNYISNIYIKFNVKNRIELINKVTKVIWLYYFGCFFIILKNYKISLKEEISNE